MHQWLAANQTFTGTAAVATQPAPKPSRCELCCCTRQLLNLQTGTSMLQLAAHRLKAAHSAFD